MTHQLALALTALGHPKLAERLQAAIDRDARGGTTDADGWPHGSGPSGGRTTTSTSPVEAAVLARTERDELHELVRKAIRHAQRVVATNATNPRHIVRLEETLSGIENLGIDKPDPNVKITPTDPGCKSCARYNDALGRPLYTPTWGGGPGSLCQWCHGWVSDYGGPRKTLPPLALIARRARGERITTAMIDAELANRGSASDARPSGNA